MTRWMPVLVRLEDYEEITRLIARLESERPAEDLTPVLAGMTVTTAIPHQSVTESSSAAERTEHPRLVGRASWSVEDLRRLCTSDALTAQRWTKAIDVCVAARDSGEEWLPTSEVAARSGMSVNEWRDAARKITRHLATNYPNVPVDESGRHVWPLAADGDHIPNNGGQVWWAVTAQTAENWREVRGNDSADVAGSQS